MTNKPRGRGKPGGERGLRSRPGNGNTGERREGGADGRSSPTGKPGRPRRPKSPRASNKPGRGPSPAGRDNDSPRPRPGSRPPGGGHGRRPESPKPNAPPADTPAPVREQPRPAAEPAPQPRARAATPLPTPRPPPSDDAEQDLTPIPGDFDEAELGIGSRVVPPALNAGWFGLDTDNDEEIGELEEAAAWWGANDVEMQEQIRNLEARLDGMIRSAGIAGGASPETTDAPVTFEAPQVAANEGDLSPVEATRELFSSEFYRRQWGRLGLRQRAEDVDDFGWDPDYERRLRPILSGLFRFYFRGRVLGGEHVPDQGPAVIVANHAGTLPLDGLMLRTALHQERGAAREVRWLAEDFVFYLPFLGVLMNRLGAVRACQENAERLLEQNALVAVFPEGEKGASKLYRDRYKLQRFGRGGYIRLCLRTGTPLIPCAIVGAEETNPMLYRLQYISKLFGLPYLPVTPTFPLLGPVGLLPAPSKWRIVFGEPISFDEYGPEAANDQVLVSRLSERVKRTIAELLEQGLRDRGGAWAV